jgi:hypothetical protein
MVATGRRPLSSNLVISGVNGFRHGQIQKTASKEIVSLFNRMVKIKGGYVSV